MKRPHLISKNGYLHIAVYVHKYAGNKLITAPDGSPKWFRKTITTNQPDNNHGRSQANEILLQYRTGNFNSSAGFTPILLTEFLDKYNLMYPTKNPASLKVYTYAVRSFTRFNGNKYLHLYSIEDIDKYISASLKRIAAVTVKNYISHLSTLFSRAIKYKHLQSNPFNDSIAIELPEPEYRVFSPSEFKQLLDVIDSPKYRDIILCYVYTGMRMSELLRLPLADIDDDFIHVTKTKTKNDRFVEIHDILKPIIAKYRSINKTYLFENFPGKPIHKRSVQDNINHYLKLAALDPRLTAKAMRKTYGSWLLDKGVPIEYIQNQLGHTNVIITQKHYSKYRKRDYKGWINKI